MTKGRFASRFANRFVLPGVALAFAVSGCAERAKPVAAPTAPERCFVATQYGASQPVAERALPASQWFSLLLYGYQPTGAITRPATDCSWRRIEWPADRCAVWPEPAMSLPLQLQSPNDLIVEKLGDDRRIVWAITERFSDGQAEGAVALTQFTPQGVRVLTLGTLRAHAIRTKLRLEALNNGAVLVAEGESCAVPQDSASCVRTARLLPVVGDRFVPADMTDGAGKCLGSTLILLKGQGSNLQHGRRGYQFESGLTFRPDGLAVHEQLAVEERDPDGGGTFLRKVQSDRMVYLQGPTLQTSAPSLLDRWANAHRAAE